MSEREAMEFDVVVVGAGLAGLACAQRLVERGIGCQGRRYWKNGGCLRLAN